MEIWKPFRNTVYEVSNMGRVRNTRSGYYKKPSTTRVGRKQLNMHFPDRTEKVLLVHRMVAEVFLGPCPLGLETNHIDGNPANNKASNLEYISHKENIVHALKHGLFPRGMNASRVKLGWNDVQQIRSLCSTGEYTHKKLAIKFGVNECQISKIVAYKQRVAA